MNQELNNTDEPDMLDEYDFSGGVRGKYVSRFPKGSSVIVLEPDVAGVFEDSELVNQALRTLTEAVTRLASVTSAEHRTLIPTKVKLEVWSRDGGKCVICGATDELHFDHDVPGSKAGTSITAATVKLLCARHNLPKTKPDLR